MIETTMVNGKVMFDISSFNAKVWAEAFCKQFPEHDEKTMAGWFANALMSGYDYCKKQYSEPHSKSEFKRIAIQKGEDTL